jgi:hypothetical protein
MPTAEGFQVLVFGFDTLESRMSLLRVTLMVLISIKLDPLELLGKSIGSRVVMVGSERGLQLYSISAVA